MGNIKPLNCHNLRITYDRETKTYFAECLDDPNIYALANRKKDLMKRIVAAMQDVNNANVSHTKVNKSIVKVRR